MQRLLVLTALIGFGTIAGAQVIRCVDAAGNVSYTDQRCPTCMYFDVTAFRSVTEPRFGNGGIRQVRGPSSPNLDMSIFRTFRLMQNKTVQLRAEVFNVTNTPHYDNPSGNINNVLFNTDGTVAALNGAGGITDVVRTGRQYDEREWRFGMRFGF